MTNQFNPNQLIDANGFLSKLSELEANQSALLNTEVDEVIDDEDEDLIDEDEDTEGAAQDNTAVEIKRYYNPSELVSAESIAKSRELKYALSFAEYQNYILTHFMNDPVYLKTKAIAWDVETNAQNTKSSKFKVIGFSNAFSKDSGIYVVNEALDFKMPEDDWQKTLQLLKLLLDQSEHVIVHNSKYEKATAQNYLNYTIPHAKIEDSMIKHRIIYPGEAAGLKPATARLLKYADWDTDLNLYKDNVKKIVQSCVTLLSAKKISEQRKNEFVLFNSFWYDPRINVQSFYITLSSAPELISTDLGMALIAVGQVFDKYKILTDDMFNLLMNKIHQIVYLGGLDTSVIPYSLIPLAIIAPYGAMDAVGAYELNSYLDSQFEVKTNEVKTTMAEVAPDIDMSSFNLEFGYQSVKAQFDAGIELEYAGVKWDDDVATAEHNWHENLIIDSWFSLFKNKKFETIIKSKYKTVMFNELVVKGCTDIYNNENTELAEKIKLALSQISPIENLSFSKVQVKFKDKVVEDPMDPNVGKYLTVRYTQLYTKYPDLFNEMLDSDYDKLFYSRVNKDVIKTYKDAALIYNPNAKGKLNENIAILDHVIRTHKFVLAAIYYECLRSALKDQYWYVEVEGQKVVKRGLENTAAIFEYLLEVKAENERRNSEKEPPLNQREVFEHFLQLVSNVNYNSDEKFKALAIKGRDFVMDSLSENTILKAYDLFVIMGVSIEDESTWTPEFEWLYHFRVYRKALKIITSFINGKVGRKQVEVVTRESLTDTLPIRIRNYYDEPYVYDKEKEELLLSVDFSICTAETGRWKSGLHTIPAVSSVKNIYRSRFKGGIICSPDYSQMEVRAIATIAGEEAMLDVFRNGGDIHTRTASVVYKKAEQDVSTAERKASKGVTFALLYGSSDRSIADDVMGGDYNKAKQFLEDFYNGYRKIKTWIDAMHEIWKRTAYIPLLSNRIIHMPFPAYDDPKYNGKYAKCLRQAQNYPIQGTSSDVAGEVLQKIIEYKREHKLKSVAFSFVHDALYFDIHPDEIAVFVPIIQQYMNEYPRLAYGLPAAADLVMGVSIGEEIKIDKFNFDQSTNSFEVIASGYLDDCDALIEQWKSIYADVSFEELKEHKGEYIPKEYIFMKKKTISRYFGQTRLKVERKILVKMN